MKVKKTKIDLNDAFVKFSNPAQNPKESPHITLIRPPILFSAQSYSTPLTLPIGIAYIAAALEKSNYRVKILDCPGAGIDEIRLTPDGKFKIQGIDIDQSIQMIDKNSDIIGVSTMFSQEWPHLRGYINKIRASFPFAKIVVGGEHVTAMPEFSLRDCPAIDFIVKGEGELAFINLVHNLRRGIKEDVNGVVYLKQGNYHESTLAPRLMKINNMPWPAWHLLNVEAYFKPNFTMGIAHGRNMAILATRGCPYQCTFCSNPTMWTTSYVMRPASDVVDEIEYYIKKYNVNSIDFYDLTAIVKKDWVMEFTEELIRRKIKIVWQLPSGTRSEALDEEVIANLAKTGIALLVYAPESGSPRILKNIKKKVKLDRLTYSIKMAVKYGIITKSNFIIGFPDETRIDVYRTLLFMWKLALLKMNDSLVSVFSPYPGSEIYDVLRDKGVLPEMNDEYFEFLMMQFDFTVTKSVCKRIGSFELLIYRVLGFSVFYGLSYLRCPDRLFRLIRIFLSKGKNFQPNSLFEQRVFDFIVRKRTTQSNFSSQIGN